MRKFLVVMDDSPEFLNAMRFAAIRAKKTGGAVVILGVVAPEEFQHWIGVGETMRAEAREWIEEHFEVFRRWMVSEEGIEPELAIREGEKATEVLAAIAEDPEVGVLVLCAGATGEGPGPLVAHLVDAKPKACPYQSRLYRAAGPKSRLSPFLELGNFGDLSVFDQRQDHKPNWAAKLMQIEYGQPLFNQRI